ncbi:MAG: efflux RND transporter periplasmic adaptor subunit [Bacteroidota bacterium]
MTGRYPLRVLLFFLITAGWIGGCRQKQAEDEQGQSAATPLVAVKTAPVKRGNIDLIVTAVGKTEALRELKVFSPIAGRVVSINVLEGMSVTQGDVLATLQTKESLAAITGAEALVEAARTPEERQEALKTLHLAEETQNRVDVHARFRGIVAARKVTEGELVPENAELLTLIDPSTIVFIADVPLRDVPSLKVGQRCFIQFATVQGRKFDAAVDAISPLSDIQTQTVRVRLRFSDLKSAAPTIFKTDMMGTARIIRGVHRDVLTVPKAALLHNDETNTYSVVMVTRDSLARNLVVQVGASSDSTVEVVTSALQVGTRVIVEGNYSLADSTKVSVAGGQ